MGPIEAAIEIAKVLRAAKVPYAIGGALAYAYWAVARATHDVDVNIFVDEDDVAGVLSLLIAAGLELDREAALRQAIERGDARGFLRGVRVDLFFNSIPLHRSASERTVTVPLENAGIEILSAEDLATLKMLFFRGKDIVDVERMVAMRGNRMDLDYVRRWLVETVGEDDARVERWDSICRRAS